MTKKASPIVTKILKTDKAVQAVGRKVKSSACGKMLGEGAYAKVFAKKNSKTQVVRVTEDSEDGYFRWAKVVGLKSNNPHFPKISKVTIHKSRRGWGEFLGVIVLEKLLGYWDIPVTAREKAFKEVGAEDLSDLEFRYFEPKTKAAKALLNALTRANGCDIHDGNVMFRKTKTGYTLVVTDPCA